MAVAADAELRRGHPGRYFAALRSAEPQPATDAQRDELTLTPDQSPGEMDQWIKDLTAGHRTFADRLANQGSQMIPSEDPDYGDLGAAFPAWTGPGREPILRPPMPEIPPSSRVLERVMDRDADWEAGGLTNWRDQGAQISSTRASPRRFDFARCGRCWNRRPSGVLIWLR